MARKIVGGPLDGHLIRRARKQHRCENFRAAKAGNAPDCLRIIVAGSYYAETDMNPYEAGGFGTDKACMACAGPEARAAVYAPGVWEDGYAAVRAQADRVAAEQVSA